MLSLCPTNWRQNPGSSYRSFKFVTVPQLTSKTAGSSQAQRQPTKATIKLHDSSLNTMLFIVAYLLIFSLVSGQILTPELELPQGKVRGLRGESGQSHYYSIPYAVSRRFQYPQPPLKWKGTLYAVNQLIRCPQMLSIVIGREDCLYLDVHVPERREKMPVIVYFHGGAFWHGGKDVYHPLLLNSNGVIVVAVNYRLGVLGFLCTNDVSNIGLRDQVAALKWVQQNIEAFGGDPDSVTICGQSAGGSLASMHLLSKVSSGLFHKAILMSGTAFSTWAFNLESDRTTKEDANKIASAITENDIYNVLEEAPLEKLMRATMGSSADPRYFRYTPCIDVNNTEPFFTDTPINILQSGNFNKVPVMIGYTDLEGMFFYALIGGVTKDLNDNFIDHLPSVFSTTTKKFKRKLADKIRKHYFGNKTIDYNKSKLNLIRFYSDWIAYGATDAYSKLLTKISDTPVYNYVFSYIGDRNFGKDLSGVNLNKSTHSDDVFYMFKPAGINIRLSDRDAIFAYKYNTMIENFVKYGNPTPRVTRYHPVSWPAATANSSNVMVLDETFSVLEEARPPHRGGFFLEMLCDYGERGYVPCDEDTKKEIKL